MTTQERFEKNLFNMGLFENQAKAIIEAAKPEIDKAAGDESYKVTWDRPESEYPDVFYSALHETVVKKAALKWIDANLPEAWFRIIFL